MKKIVLGILAVGMMILSLSAAPAQAGPYTGTVATKTSVTPTRASVPVGDARILARALVRPVSGAATPRGVVVMTCKTRDAAGKLVTRTGPRQAYRGGVRGVVGPRLYMRKSWTCSVRFVGGATVYKGSTGPAFNIRVR